MRNAFLFSITSSGSYSVRKYDNNETDKIFSWTKHSAIKKGNGAINRLTIRKINNTIKFYINNTYINKMPFQPFFGNRIGFKINKNQKIAVDYFKISYLEKSVYNAAPKITITVPNVSRGFDIVKTSKLNVVGRAKDNDGIKKVLVNGIRANLRANGYFSVEVPLSAGRNKITVKATDTKGKTGIETFTIRRKAEQITNNNTTDEKRVALVVGNSAYSNSANLGGNPINDARDITATLKALDFEVTLKSNADLSTMNRAIRQFGRSNKDADIVLFYFAGHGIQVDGINYLMPIGTNLQDKNDVGFECVSVNTVQKIMETSNSKRLNMIILDACRNNPFRKWQRGGNTGLSAMTPPSGTILAFATSPNSTASNGRGRNGLYTGELIKQLKIPQRIEDVFINTRIAVERKSGGTQSPWELARLRGKYFLKK